jgi:hypothetical protein
VSDFTVGDFIRIKIKKYFYDIDITARIYEYEVDVNSAGVEKLNLTIGDFISHI